MTLYHPVLELDADVDDDGNREVGVFEMRGNVQANIGGNVGYALASGGGSTLNAILASSQDSVGDLLGSQPQEPAKRRGFYLDLGGGRSTFDIQFMGWKGSNEADVPHMQWGVPDGKTSLQSAAGDQYGTFNAPAKYDQTGGNTMAQIGLLQEFLFAGEYDSRAPHARLYLGEHSTGIFSDDGSAGLYGEWHHVTVLDWNFNKTGDAPIAFDGVITLARTRGWRDIIDAFDRLA